MNKNTVRDALNLSEPVEQNTAEMEIVESPKKYLSGEVLDNEETKRLEEYAKNNIKEAIDVSMEVMHELRDLSKATEHPRSYEVFSQIVKNIVDSNKELLNINRNKVANPAKVENPQNADTINNIVFQGSTEEMLKVLKKSS